MTYQGERARSMATENGRCFKVSKVRINADDHVSEVLRGEVDGGSDRVVGTCVVATAAEVVDAIHDGAQGAAVSASNDPLPERGFVVVQHPDGRECIALDGAQSVGRNVTDRDALDD